MSDTLAWIRNVVASLDSRTDEETRQRVLEPCGWQCSPTSLGTKARGTEGVPTLGAFLDRLHSAFDAVTSLGEEIHVVYPECHCVPLRGIPVSEIPDAYCPCSVGWVEELFGRRRASTSVWIR